MHNNFVGLRVQQFREHFKLSRKELHQEIGMSLANISRIEAGKLEPSEAFLNALIVRFAANPDWIKTGQGEMLASPADYLAKGMRLLGAKAVAEAFINLLKDPEFAEAQSYIAVNNMSRENTALPQEVMVYLEHILKIWHEGDQDMKTWLLVQLKRSFPEVGEKKG
jgi:transcriptional regulator with XRE-family HTH domain